MTDQWHDFDPKVATVEDLARRLGLQSFVVKAWEAVDKSGLNRVFRIHPARQSGRTTYVIVRALLEFLRQGTSPRFTAPNHGMDKCMYQRYREFKAQLPKKFQYKENDTNVSEVRDHSWDDQEAGA